MPEEMLMCPECNRKLKQVGDEDMYCTGRRKAGSIGHKKLQKMRPIK